MIEFFHLDERGQSFPLIAIAMVLIFMITTAIIGLGWLTYRRSEMQSAADAAALAGANALAKTQMTVAALELTQFTVDLAADVLIAAGSLATYFGVGAPVLQAGVQLKTYSETKLDPALNKTKDFVNMVGPVYAIANAVAYANANHCSGVGIPWPVEGLGRLLPSTDKTKDASDYLKKMQELAAKLEEYERKIREADAKMTWLKRTYPDNYLVVDVDGDGKNDFDEAAGSKGGSTTWKRKTEAEMTELAKRQRKVLEEEKKALASKKPSLTAGKNGIVVVVWKKSERIPFSSFFGSQETGFNVAFSAARTETGRKTLGATAIDELFKSHPAFAGLGSATFGSLVNAVGWLYKTKSSLGGALGFAVDKALDLLGLEPPNVFERRVVLASTEEVLASDSFFIRQFPAIVEFVKEKAAALPSMKGGK